MIKAILFFLNFNLNLYFLNLDWYNDTLMLKILPLYNIMTTLVLACIDILYAFKVEGLDKGGLPYIADPAHVELIEVFKLSQANSCWFFFSGVRPPDPVLTLS